MANIELAGTGTCESALAKHCASRLHHLMERLRRKATVEWEEDWRSMQDHRGHMSLDESALSLSKSHTNWYSRDEGLLFKWPWRMHTVNRGNLTTNTNYSASTICLMNDSFLALSCTPIFFALFCLLPSFFHSSSVNLHNDLCGDQFHHVAGASEKTQVFTLGKKESNAYAMVKTKIATVS